MKILLLNALYILTILAAPFLGTGLGILLDLAMTYHVPSEGLEGAWFLVVPPAAGFLAGLGVSWRLLRALWQ